MKRNVAIKFIFFIPVLCFLFQTSNAAVRLPQLIMDSMVLQRDMRVKIWGWAAPNEKISLNFLNKKYKTAADSSGNWQITLAPMKAGGPFTMTIDAGNHITLHDILIGDVWLCSGQSNMVHQLNIHDVTYASDIANANYPEIRQLVVPTIASFEGPKTDVTKGEWKPAVGEAVRPFSAVAFFFAKMIYEKYHVPIGIINVSVGGPPIESWTSEEGLKAFPEMITTIQKNKDTAYVNNINRKALEANKKREPDDKGLKGSIRWYDTAYIPKGWRNINVPGYWEDQGIKDLDGIVWYRKEINVPASMTGMPAKVFLGRIVDADILYINGKQVGNTAYQYPQRRYMVPAGILKTGNNVLVVKVVNDAGKGGFVPDKPYCLFAGKDTIDLKGTWQYKVADVFIPNKYPASKGIVAQEQPTGLFNGMIAPLVNYSIKGIVWYQGEGNTNRPLQYKKLLPALIYDWRNKWQQDSLPFVYAQLPNFMDATYLPAESNWALLRESQLKTLSVPNTAMAVTIDLGEWNDIHPDNKKDVGERLAMAARNLVYHETGPALYSPLFQSSSIEGNRIRISFTNTGSGLITSDGEAPGRFEIAGADKHFVWASAVIENDKVIVWNENISNPMYVRYAWADNPAGANLYSKEGLPASPFRTDE